MIVIYGTLVWNNDICRLFFHFFKILIFWVVMGGKRAKTRLKWQNNLLYHSPYLSNRTSYDHHLWYTSVKGWYLQAFFHFSKILIFQVVSGVKGQKMAQNDKKFCLSHFILQEPYIIWLSFMVHLCKMMISPGLLSFFQNFDFLGF